MPYDVVRWYKVVYVAGREQRLGGYYAAASRGCLRIFLKNTEPHLSGKSLRPLIKKVLEEDAKAADLYAAFVQNGKKLAEDGVFALGHKTLEAELLN